MKPGEYQLKIQLYQTHDDLVPLWEDIVSDQVVDWAGGMALQYLIVRVFEIEGADATYAFQVKKPTSNPAHNGVMEEIDGVVYLCNYSLAVVIESKDKDVNVNNAPIANLGGQLLRRPPGVLSAVFSSKDFTQAVYDLADLAHSNKSLLWTVDDIDLCLRNKCFIKGMIAKYKYAVERGNYAADLKTIWGYR